MKKEFYISGVNDKFRLIFAADGITRTVTAEEMYARYADEDDSIDGYHDMYDKMTCAVYVSDRENFIIFIGSDDESGCNGAMPTVDEMLEFIDSTGSVMNELNSDERVIVHVSQLAGTTTDYLLIFDNLLHADILNMNSVGILGAILDYERWTFAECKDGGRYKYAMIRDGKYSKLF